MELDKLIERMEKALEKPPIDKPYEEMTAEEKTLTKEQAKEFSAILLDGIGDAELFAALHCLAKPLPEFVGNIMASRTFALIVRDAAAVALTAEDIRRKDSGKQTMPVGEMLSVLEQIDSIMKSVGMAPPSPINPDPSATSQAQ